MIYSIFLDVGGNILQEIRDEAVVTHNCYTAQQGCVSCLSYCSVDRLRVILDTSASTVSLCMAEKEELVL